MELFIIITILVFGYWIYHRSSKKSSPVDELSIALNTREEQLTDSQKLLLFPLFAAGTSDYYSVEKRFEEIISTKASETAEEEKPIIEKAKIVRKKYLRLNERFKNSSISDRWEIVSDWSDFLYAINFISYNLFAHNFVNKNNDKKSINSTEEKHLIEIEKQKIKLEEIERRFDKKLALN